MDDRLDPTPRPPLGRREFTTTALLGLGATLATSRPALAQAAEPSSERNTARTRFAVNVEMWFGSLPFLDRVRATADLGFPLIEFWPTDGKPIEELARLSRKLNVGITQFTAWGFGSELNNPRSDHREFLKAIEQSCEIANQLDCSLFTVVVGNDIAGVSKDAMHTAAIEGLKRAAPICEKYGKTIIIEPMNPRNHPGHCLYGSHDAIKICEAVGSPAVKINWDLYHMQIVEGDLCMRLREGWKHVGYLQLADNPGRHEPGTGEVNYSRVLREIHDLGYTGGVGLECSPLEGEARAAERVRAADAT